MGSAELRLEGATTDTMMPKVPAAFSRSRGGADKRGPRALAGGRLPLYRMKAESTSSSHEDWAPRAGT